MKIINHIGDTIMILYCTAVDRDREFAYISFACIKFCVLLPSFECLWKSFCFPWVILDSLWLPWDAGGSLWGTLGSQGELGVTLGREWTSLRHSYLERLQCLRIKSDLAEFSAGIPRSAVSRRSGARAAAPNPTSLAPGARMTWV